MADIGKEWEQSNEQLAIKAQAGDETSKEQLYRQSRRLIFYHLRKYRWALAHDRAVEQEDLEQAGAEGFLYALEKYRPEDGIKFSTVLAFGIKNRLRPLLHLGERKRAHVGAVSLDEPLAGDDGEEFTRADLLADDNAVDPEESACVRDMRRRVHDNIQEALEKLPKDEERVIRGTYLEGTSFDKLALSKNEGERLRMKGIRRMRQNQKLMRFAQSCYDSFFWHVGWGAYSTTFTSAVELAAIRREEISEKADMRIPCLKQIAGMQGLSTNG